MALHRTDAHRPSALDPRAYTYLFDFSNAKPELFQPAINRDQALDVYVTQRRGVQIHGGIFACDICGAHYTYGSLFEHTSGAVISVGHDCADKLELARDFAEGDRVLREAKRLRMVEVERRQRWSGLIAWARDRADEYPCVLPALKTDHLIVRDIRERLVNSGAKWGLSPKQEALVLKLYEESLKPKVEETHVPVPIVEGRQRIEGEVVSVKHTDGYYGVATKITVKVTTPDGTWIAWGTMPTALYDVAAEEWRDEHAPRDAEGARPWHRLPEERELLVGRTVGFDAKLKQGRDAHFALFSRPTKPELKPRS